MGYGRIEVEAEANSIMGLTDRKEQNKIKCSERNF